jgi:parallel beta-helix repeat protein
MFSRAAGFAVLAAAAVAICAAPGGAGAQCVRTITPGESVEAMVADLAPGQTGCLAGGTFFEDVTVRGGGAAGAPITIAAAPGETPTLRGRLWIADSANWVTVEGLVLDGRNSRDLPSPSIHGDHVTFRNNDVTNHRAGGGGEGHGICFIVGSADGWGVADETVLENNRIHDCGVSDNHNHGIYIESSRSARIVGNLIYDNGDRGIQFYPDAQGTLVQGNVIDGNGSGVLFSGNAGLASSGNRVVGNVISNSRNRFNIESWYPEGNPIGRANFATRNCVWNGERGEIADEWGFTAASNTVADPQFVDRAAKDFRLRLTSRCAAVVTGDIELLAVHAAAPAKAPTAGRKTTRRTTASKPARSPKRK